VETYVLHAPLAAAEAHPSNSVEGHASQATSSHAVALSYAAEQEGPSIGSESWMQAP
jgi:hypothetical protein